MDCARPHLSARLTLTTTAGSDDYENQRYHCTSTRTVLNEWAGRSKQAPGYTRSPSIERVHRFVFRDLNRCVLFSLYGKREQNDIMRLVLYSLWVTLEWEHFRRTCFHDTSETYLMFLEAEFRTESYSILCLKYRISYKFYRKSIF